MKVYIKVKATSPTKHANTTHGLTGHYTYSFWRGIKQRCYNSNCKSFINYGGRGIILYKEWSDNFLPFYNYVMSLENAMVKLFTIDRINNNGNYEPNNIRWADRHTQSANRGMMPSNTSGYTGVDFRKSNGKWVAKIKVNYRLIYLGSFNTPCEAAISRDEYIIDNDLKEYKLQVL